MAVKLSPDQKQATIKEWQAQVKQLLGQVETWAKEQGWEVARTKTKIQEFELPPYNTQSLEIRIADKTRAHLEPIARFTLNGKGVVELYGWPGLRRVRLQPAKTNGALTWIVMTDSGIPLHQPWNAENFYILVNDLVA
ncbi:MAG TPA: hypothetical protein VFJ58_25170 [Armatimonadota bacterium]|nr:hypothetical protein [Armatimonadota bacterium]